MDAWYHVGNSTTLSRPHATPHISAMTRYISGFAHNGQVLDGGDEIENFYCVPYLAHNMPTKQYYYVDPLRPLLHPQITVFQR